MKEVMRRSAADNAYLHKDFHGALSSGLSYLERVYGADAVRDYLRQFASTYYAPLTKEINERGLIALKEHYERIYQMEGGVVEFDLSADQLVMKVEACPALAHIRQEGYPVSPLFYETTKSVDEAICAETPFAVDLESYDQQTGRSTVRFYRRQA
jgi:hypothetical protein